MVHESSCFLYDISRVSVYFVLKGRSTKPKLCLPENVVDMEQLHSRIFSQAPLQAPSYTSSATFFVNRHTKAQRVTQDCRKRIEIEPLVKYLCSFCRDFFVSE